MPDTDLTVTVDADTEQFTESIERATEAIEEFQEALDELEDTPVSVTVVSRGDSTVAEVTSGLEEELESHNLR